MFDDSDSPLEPGTPSRPEGEGDASLAHAQREGDASLAHAQREGDASPAHAQREGDASPAHAQREGEPSPAHAQREGEPSPAQARFRACRWHAEADDQKYCSNRDVLPYAGRGGFDPEAWCPDCTFYKLRRTPKKQPRPEEDDYPY